jgi:hypothetical protein
MISINVIVVIIIVPFTSIFYFSTIFVITTIHFITFLQSISISASGVNCCISNIDAFLAISATKHLQ